MDAKTLTSLLARGQEAQRQGRLGEAESCYRQALQQQPNQPAVLYALAEVLEDAKQIGAAIATLQHLLRYAPEHPQTHHYLGLLFSDTGRYQDAISHFRRATELKPDYTRAWNNLGNALRSQGRPGDAIDAFNAAIRAQPDYVLAYFNVSGALRDQGRFEDAEKALRQALRLDPGHRESLIALASVLRYLHRLDEAIPVYRRAIALAPSKSAAQISALSQTLIDCGQSEEAKRLCTEALVHMPQSLRLVLPASLTLAPVYSSAAEQSIARAAYATGLGKLREQVETFARSDPVEVIESLIWSNFYLAYHGENDLALQAEYADFVGALLDRLLPEFRQPVSGSKAAGRRVRIGFASSFFYDCTAGVYFKSWITGLDRRQFDIHVYHLRAGMNPLAQDLAAHADVFREFRGTRDIRKVAATIRGDALDILVYPELGMDGLAFLLSALRLAPVQCAGWGHPVTTGQQTIDWFISSDTMEPPDADQHYRERLLRLPGLGTCYTPPPIPTTQTRKELGLPEVGNLYLLPQSLYKIHPENDALMAKILAADPDGLLVLFPGRHPNVTGQFLWRLQTAFDHHRMRVQDRARVLPYVPRETYLRINSVCDVMLDTLHWSGGNTSLDALAAGLPIVTLPGRFMRGRQTYGMLNMIGLSELVAQDEDDYVRIATGIARDKTGRMDIVERIASGRCRLFDDLTPIAALRDFWLSVSVSSI